MLALGQFVGGYGEFGIGDDLVSSRVIIVLAVIIIAYFMLLLMCGPPTLRSALIYMGVIGVSTYALIGLHTGAIMRNHNPAPIVQGGSREPKTEVGTEQDMQDFGVGTPTGAGLHDIQFPVFEPARVPVSDIPVYQRLPAASLPVPTFAQHLEHSPAPIIPALPDVQI